MKKIKINQCIFCTFFLIAIFKMADSYSQNKQDRPVADVFSVFETIEQINDNSYWPNFIVSEIPVMVFDSINTWIFYSTIIPDGFIEVEDHKGLYKYMGQHPLVRGNSIVKVDNSWIATSIMSSYSKRTGEKYNATDLAGIIIHEQFHVFQRTKHRGWRQNDGYLLLYPTETQESLFLRRIEKEAFKRAVLSNKPSEIAGWVKEALNLREQRLKLIDSVFGLYEKELQRTEGLSDYIEKVVRGVDPLNASDITNGIAPAGVRDLGYVEGRWIAMILDKLNPDWKIELEQNDALYLEDILKNEIKDLPYESINFSSFEIDKFKTDAETDFKKWNIKKNEEVKQLNDVSGFRIEINASSKPLAIRIFEPLEIEILENRSVYHRLIFAAGNESGTLRIRNQPSISWFDNSLGIVKVVFSDLKESPEIIENENRILINNNNVTIDLKYSKIRFENSLYSIEL